VIPTWLLVICWVFSTINLFRIVFPDRIDVKWLWFDFWVGLYWDTAKRVLYVGVIPTVVVVIRIGKP
jgi:hypothetical protein